MTSVDSSPAPAETAATGDGQSDRGVRRGGLIPAQTVHASISFIVFLVVFVGYSIWLGGSFTNASTRMLDVHQNTPVFVVALAALVTLIAGQFDLSIASMATLTTFLTVGLAANQHWSFALIVVACLVVGLLGGLANGILVVKAGVNTFIATLGTGAIFLGLSAVYSKGSPVAADGSLPTWFSGPDSLGSFASRPPAAVVWIAFGLACVALLFSLRKARPGRVAARAWDLACGVVFAVLIGILLAAGSLTSWIDGVSWMIAVLLVIGLALWVLLNMTTFGRYVHATGSNAAAAGLAGVKPGTTTIRAFVLGGLLAAIAGILLAASQGSATPNIGTGFLLPAFAAAFLSTVILSTGKFSVFGTLVGGTFLVWVSQGLIVGGLPFTWTEVVNGAVLIIAVAFSSVFKRARE
jgi:ribose/xylose/arabinose/galactoside ABC-type transport system permease subunit